LVDLRPRHAMSLHDAVVQRAAALLEQRPRAHRDVAVAHVGEAQTKLAGKLRVDTQMLSIGGATQIQRSRVGIGPAAYGVHSRLIHAAHERNRQTQRNGAESCSHDSLAGEIGTVYAIEAGPGVTR